MCRAGILSIQPLIGILSTGSSSLYRPQSQIIKSIRALSTTMQESPVILLVQGSFQSPTVYQQLTQSLQALGYVTTHPRLPSCTNTDDPDFPKTTLVDDALAVRLELIRQVEYEGKTVVVAMHSYGGLVGSEAIPEDLSYTKRRSSGLQGGVVHLFYLCAFILDKGQSVLDTFGESPTNHVHVREHPLAIAQKTYQTHYRNSQTGGSPS